MNNAQTNRMTTMPPPPPGQAPPKEETALEEVEVLGWIVRFHFCHQFIFRRRNKAC